MERKEAILQIGNGSGCLYVTRPDLSKVESYPNIPLFVNRLKKIGQLSGSFGGPSDAVGIIRFTAVAGVGNVYGLLVNGVTIKNNTAGVIGDPEATAVNAAAGINSLASVPDYRGIANGEYLYIFPMAGTGASVNGFTIQLTAHANITFEIITPTMVGGNDADTLYDQSHGRRFFVNPNGVAGSIAGATEVTVEFIPQTMNSPRLLSAVTAINPSIRLSRTSNHTYAEIEGPTANIDSILTDDFIKGDKLTIWVKNGDTLNLNHAADNIILDNEANYTSDSDRHSITLVLREYAGGLKWVEEFRSNGVPATIAAIRAAGIPIRVSGVKDYTLIAGGSTLTLDPATDEGTVRLNANVTITGNNNVVGGGSPIEGDSFTILGNSLVTYSGASLIIFGITVPAALALVGKWQVEAVWDGSAWKSRLLIDVNTTNALSGAILSAASIPAGKYGAVSIVAADIAADAVTTAKILNSNVTTAKIADANVTPIKVSDSLKEIWKQHVVSFETGEICLNRIHFPGIVGTYKVMAIQYTIVKAIAATDAATIEFHTNAGKINEFDLSIAASTAINTNIAAVAWSASANNVINAANPWLELRAAKATAGGKALVSFLLVPQ